MTRRFPAPWIVERTEGGFKVLDDARQALDQEQPGFPWLRNREAQWVKPKLNMKVKDVAGARLLRHATVKAVC